MKLPKTYYNPLTLLGSIIAAVAAVIIVFMMVSNLLFDYEGAYMGIFIYMILPFFLVIGLILIPIGMSRRAKRIKREGEESTSIWTRIDLSDSRQWNAIAIFIFVTIVFLFLTGIGSYQAFHYSESNEFCGTLCHTVMEPEYVAYQESAHSRVTCVECHVGSGADWYVKSKLSGLYQVYSVTFNKYPTPIETPIHSLRPARETCEECHWPEKFYSHRLHNEKHYLADYENTEWNIQLKMKIGPEHKSGGLIEGIHWHVNKEVKIDYIASTHKREYLPWVRYINTSNGDTVIYQDIYETLEPEAMDTLELREMDCLDCHNRPSHQYLPPQKFTDELIAEGSIPAELPEVKFLAMQVFNNTFTTRDSGRMLIEEQVRDYYSTSYSELAESKPQLIDQAIEGLLAGYNKHIFPEMKASWDAYPEHVGHVEYNGCFRCHNGNHQSEDGRIISRDCNLCHTILAQGTSENFETTSVDSSLVFRHPVDIDMAWTEMACADCHRYLY
jgi:hypothetical protein